MTSVSPLGLIEMLPGRTVGGENGMGNKGVEYDLAHYVKLTDAGVYCARRLTEENVDPKKAE